MNSRVVEGFRKTDHCLQRQKQRNISDELLALIFQNFTHNSQKRLYLIVQMSFLKKLNLIQTIPYFDTNEAALVIRLNKNCITTCYFCPDPEYLYQAHPEFNFFNLY